MKVPHPVAMSWILLAGLKPAAAAAACLFIADPATVQPLDSSRLVHKAPNGGSVLAVTGCFIGSGATVSVKSDTVCEGDTITVDRQQCLVKSIQSTTVGQVGQPRATAPASSGQGVPDVVPLLQKP